MSEQISAKHSARHYAKSYVIAIVLLAFMVLVSALGVVYNSYNNRQVFIAINDARKQQIELQVEYGKLLLEQSTWSSPAHIEAIAASRLQMRPPANDEFVLVKNNKIRSDIAFHKSDDIYLGTYSKAHLGAESE